MTELKVQDNIDYDKLKKIMSNQKTVMVGFEAGKQAEKANSLYHGFAISEPYMSPRGNMMFEGRDFPINVPPRPFLTDGFFYDKDNVNKWMKEYYTAVVSRPSTDIEENELGASIGVGILQYVFSDPYSAEKPNSAEVWQEKGEGEFGKVPLVDTEEMIKSMIYKTVRS